MIIPKVMLVDDEVPFVASNTSWPFSESLPL